MILCWLFIYRRCILHSGIMLPRFHDSSFTYNIWHSAFWNYVASIPCSLFHLRYLNSASPILELCCLDSMFLFLFTVCAFCILELCCLDSMFLLSFTVFKILHSPFWNYVASILCSFFFTVCAFWNYVASIA